MGQVPSTRGGCPPWDGPWAPVLGRGPGWGHKARVGYPGTGGVQRAEPPLAKTRCLGRTVHPKKLVCTPCEPSSGAPGVSRQSRAQLQGSPGFRNCSNEPSGAAGFPPIPAFQSLQSLTNSSKRGAGHWDGAGCQRVLQHQTKGGAGCFGVRAGAGWRCVVRTGLQQPRFSKGAREALNNWDS